MSGQPAFDFKANYLKFLKHEETPFIPNEFVGNSILGFGAINGPSIEKGGEDGSPDGFGVYWVCPETGGGAAIPKPGEFLLDDICDWREKVTIPDAASFDWEAEAAKELANVDRNQTVVAFGFGNGVFERLAALMGFEEALLAIMEEPEEVYALFEAITDYKIQALDYIQKTYNPDVVTYYDDVATERDLFISPKTYRELIKPHHKRFAQACIDRGIIPFYHCCGKAEAIVEDMIDCGWNSWSSVQPTNDIETLIQKYGKSINFIGGWDSTGTPGTPFATHEEIVAEVKRVMDTYGKFGYGFSFFGFRYPQDGNPAVMAQYMGEIVGEAMQYSMGLMMQKLGGAR